MIVDGQGEWGSISYYTYQGSRLKEIHRVKGEESLGILYSVCTELCGFNVEKGEEWKLMGLAPYGKLDQEILAEFRSLLKIDGLSIKYVPLPQIEACENGSKSPSLEVEPRQERSRDRFADQARSAETRRPV